MRKLRCRYAHCSLQGHLSRMEQSSIQSKFRVASDHAVTYILTFHRQQADWYVKSCFHLATLSCPNSSWNYKNFPYASREKLHASINSQCLNSNGYFFTSVIHVFWKDEGNKFFYCTCFLISNSWSWNLNSLLHNCKKIKLKNGK